MKIWNAEIDLIIISNLLIAISVTMSIFAMCLGKEYVFMSLFSMVIMGIACSLSYEEKKRKKHDKR